MRSDETGSPARAGGPVSNGTTNLRVYGSQPFTVAVVHGGPGAGGEMAPVARKLAGRYGVLEPIQTALSLDGQVEELREILAVHGRAFTLVGYSWGAWLAFILAARYPDLVRKLVLVSSGPFEERYVAQLGTTRMSRLSEAERREFQDAIAALGDPDTPDKDAQMARLGTLAAKSDAYDRLPDAPGVDEHVGPRGDVFQSVWQAAAAMRRSGELLAMSQLIRCPLVAIHGDYDPHPADGVRDPLSTRLEDFRFVLLQNCGHTPWRERQAQGAFYGCLEAALE